MPDVTLMPLEQRKAPEDRRLRTDGGTQPRAARSEALVQDLTEWLRRNKGKELDAAVGFRDGARVWLADGFHRHEAYCRAGRSHMPVEVRPGTLSDARIFAASCNQRPQALRTNADKRRAVEMVLDEVEADPGRFMRWNNCTIAAHCGVDESTVRKIKKDRDEAQSVGIPDIDTDEVDEGEEGGDDAPDDASTDDPADLPALEEQTLGSAGKLLASLRALARERARPQAEVLEDVLARALAANGATKAEEEALRAARKYLRQADYLARLRGAGLDEVAREKLALAAQGKRAG